MPDKSLSSVFPRIVGLLQDGKERTTKEVAQELNVSVQCVRYLFIDAMDGRLSHRIHRSGYRLTKSRQVALYALGPGKQAAPISVFPFTRDLNHDGMD